MSEFDISKVLEVLNDKKRLILKQNLRLKIPGFSDINKVPLALLVCSIKRSKYVSRPESCEKYISDNMEIDEELLFRDIKNGDCSPGVIAVHLLISHDPVKVAMQF